MADYLRCNIVDDLFHPQPLKDVPEALYFAQLPKQGEHITHNNNLYEVKRIAYWPAHRDSRGIIVEDGIRPDATLELAKV